MTKQEKLIKTLAEDIVNLGFVNITTSRQKNNGTIMFTHPYEGSKYGIYKSGYVRSLTYNYCENITNFVYPEQYEKMFTILKMYLIKTYSQQKYIDYIEQNKKDGKFSPYYKH